jgi:hydroxyethylthiazole kinase-like uncharacterized protein yjeF
VSVPKDENFILQIAIPEVMLILRNRTIETLNSYSALGIGCGMGTSTKAETLLRAIISKVNIPLLLDADALNMISNNKSLLQQIPPASIITPHPKEFDRLFGMHNSEDDRRSTAIQKAQEFNITIVLKGHKTLVTMGGAAFVNTTGNAGLAKGGSGDALTGIITAFLAQGYTAFDAAKIGVFIHGLAADLSLDQQSMESLLITDVIENLGKAFRYIFKN